jgi:hypothetical protein
MIDELVNQGFVRIDDAFPRELADAGRELLWRDTGCDPAEPATWTRPVVRLGFYGQSPFALAATTPRLTRAFDVLVGQGRWLPRADLGTFPVRFPSAADPGDTGWHVDMSFGIETPDFLDWRVNVTSRGRGLLMLFLFSDVGDDDAPTRLRAGSHIDIAQLLAPAGDAGMTLRELVAADFAGSAARPEATATGPAGTVYLCHPFLVHAAQRHRGTDPRFMAQPPLHLASPLRLDRADRDTSAVERAIRDAVGTAGESSSQS